MNERWTDERVADLGVQVPAWIDRDLTCATVEAIVQGGCLSGAYMPAVTYHEALQTMSEHGDAVFDYLEGAFGDVPAMPAGEIQSWSGMAVFYLSVAVEEWANNQLAQVRDEQETTGGAQ